MPAAHAAAAAVPRDGGHVLRGLRARRARRVSRRLGRPAHVPGNTLSALYAQSMTSVAQSMNKVLLCSSVFHPTVGQIEKDG